MAKKINIFGNIYFAVIILFVLGFLVYSNILYAPFVFDDEYYIVNNPQIKDLSNFLDFAGTRYIGFLSFAVNYYFGGLNTFGYHLVNIVIHILNAMLVYILIQAMGNRLEAIGKPIDHSPAPIAFFVSLIFLVHPIQTQAVTYITQRFESLAVFFYLLAIVLYIKARGYGLEAMGKGGQTTYRLSPIAYSLSLISAILAMKTKEISFTLPFAIILYEFTFFNPPTPPLLKSPSFPPLKKGDEGGLRGDFLKRFLYLIPYVLTLLIIPLTIFTSGNGLSEELRAVGLEDIKYLSKYEYLTTQFCVIVTYIRLLFLPVNQNLDYDYPIYKTFFEPSVVLSFLFLLTIFSFAIYLHLHSRKTHHAHGLLISFGILWFFITLSVTSSIIPIKDVIFEHRVYLPSIGFILASVSAIFYGFESIEKRLHRSLFVYLLAVILAISISFLFAAYNRNIVWKSEEGIYTDAVKKSPQKARPRNYLAMVYQKQGRIDEAIKEERIALSLPSSLHHIHHYNLGLGLMTRGLLNDAVNEFLEAVKLKSDYGEAYYRLGMLFVELGRLEDAEENIKKALELQQLKSDKSDLHDELGNVYLMQGKYSDAINEYEKAVNLDKNNVEAIYNIAMAYEKVGSKDKSIEFYKKFIEMSHPDYENEKERAKTRIKELTKND